MDWACEGTNKWVFRLIAGGALLVLVPGVILGAMHGSALQTELGAAELAKKAVRPMRIAFLGELLFLLGSLVFLGSLLCLLARNCCGDRSPMSLWRTFRAAKEGGAE